jgi:phosphoribosylformylglycinamidine synthase
LRRFLLRRRARGRCGWAKSILFHARAREQFRGFFKRGDSFTLHVCSGCRMLANLHEIIPGAYHWPSYARIWCISGD